MKVLTITATIFIPLTFTAGIYGMNFEYMPELKLRWGYPLVLVIMLAIGVVMLILFRRKKWFQDRGRQAPPWNPLFLPTMSSRCLPAHDYGVDCSPQ